MEEIFSMPFKDLCVLFILSKFTFVKRFSGFYTKYSEHIFSVAVTRKFEKMPKSL
jgi:hypothetical protein